MAEIADLTVDETAVLQTLSLDWSLPFKAINAQLDTAIGIDRVREACRSLRRRGLADYSRGLFDEDGRAAGSGYALTPVGQAFLARSMEPSAGAAEGIPGAPEHG